MPNGSSLTMSTTFSVESRRMVRHFLPSFQSHRPHNLPGTGAVYSFDPVGSYEREACRAAGAAQSLVQPFLDNQVSLFLSSLRFSFFSISSPSKFLSLPLRDMYISKVYRILSEFVPPGEFSVQNAHAVYSVHRYISRTRWRLPE